eukprot:155578-Chlamydomonas_euryale.AAC.2
MAGARQAEGAGGREVMLCGKVACTGKQASRSLTRVCERGVCHPAAPSTFRACLTLAIAHLPYLLQCSVSAFRSHLLPA